MRAGKPRSEIRGRGDPVAEGGQQQQGGQQQGGQQQGDQQQQQQQQPSPVQLMGRALTDIRKVQNMLELQNPGQTEASKMQLEAGDLVWQVIQTMQQSQQQQSQ
jgi:hypothetical protein